jgi:hypothetical protein
LEGVTEVEVQEDEDDDHVEDETIIVDPCLNATMYDREDQQIEIDLPMKADLNKKETVLGLIKGALDTRQRVLDSSGTLDTNEKPVMDDCGITTGGDGAPSHTFLGLEAADPEAFANVNNQSGGFHNHLNLQQRIGCRFAESHLRDYLHPFRDTDKKKDWFLSPGDPGQTLLEQPEMSAAHYVIAMRNLSRIRLGESMSAVDVHDFMLERALEFDHCMVVLMWLHFVEVSNVIRDSEKENDPDLYRAGARLALLLYVKTHAIKYVRMGVQYWVWWHCSSEADKILHDKFYWTKKTTNGRTIWFDRFVEWFNKDVREYLGKYAKPNQELLLQRTALLTRERKRARVGAPTKRPEVTQEEKTLAISPIFCSQMDLIDQWNLWGDGPVLVGKAMDLEPPTRFTDPSGKNALNVNMLFDVSSAEKTLMAYFEYSSLEGAVHKVSRSEKEVSLRMTPATLEDIKQARSDELKRLTSTDTDALMAVTTVAYLKARLQQLLDKYAYLARIATPDPNSKKRSYAEALSKFHRKIIEKERHFVRTIKNELREKSAGSDGYADPQKKREELKLMFYALTDEAKAKFLERKYTIPFENDGADNDNTGFDEDESNADGDYPPDTPARTTQSSSDTPFVVRRRFDRLSI